MELEHDSMSWRADRNKIVSQVAAAAFAVWLPENEPLRFQSALISEDAEENII